MSLLTDIASRFQFTETHITWAGTVYMQVALARPNRYAIGFSTEDTNVAFLSTNGLDLHGGFPIYQNNKIEWLYAKDVGPVAQAAWFWYGVATLHPLTVWEVIDTQG